MKSLQQYFIKEAELFNEINRKTCTQKHCIRWKEKNSLNYFTKQLWVENSLKGKKLYITNVGVQHTKILYGK